MIFAKRKRQRESTFEMERLHKLGKTIERIQKLIGLSCPRRTTILLQTIVVVQIYFMVSQNSNSIPVPTLLSEQRRLWKVPQSDSIPEEYSPVKQQSQILLATGESYTCSAWRSTDGCSPKGLRHTKTALGSILDEDLSCDEYVPITGAGYCELVSSKGEMVHTFQKSCLEGQFRPDYLIPYFTCDMAVSFMNYKYRAHQYEPDHPLNCAHNTSGVREHTRNAITGKVEPVEPLVDDNMIAQRIGESVTAAGVAPGFDADHGVSGDLATRGIVMEVYSQAIISTFAVVQTLREVHGCNLPIELWSAKDEDITESPLVQEMLAMKNVRLRVIHDPNIHAFMTKPFSIAYSSFDQILFLDSDNFPIRDPSYLFDSPEFQSTGAMFWKDFWATARNEFYLTKDSVIWELLGIPNDSPITEEVEMESGEILIDRRKSEKALKVLLFLTKTYHEFLEPLSLVLGDKDLFRLAFHLSQTPFHYISHPPSLAGYKTTRFSSDRICGRTMVQHDHMGSPLFFHRNGAKLKSEKDIHRVWEAGLEFVGADPQAQYFVEHRPSVYRLESCYHCSAHVREFFKEIDYDGTDVELFEKRILEIAHEAFRIEKLSESPE